MRAWKQGRARVYAAAMADLVLEFAPVRARSRVRIARGAFAQLGKFVRETTGAEQVVLVTDARVGALYGAAAGRSLARAGISVRAVRVPRGEGAKRAPVLARLWDA